MKKISLKILAATLAFTITAGMFTPSDYSLAIAAHADTSPGTAKYDRLHEGKKNTTEDVDAWNDFNVDESFAYQVRMATNYANRMYTDEVGIGEEITGTLNMSNIAPFFGFTDGEIPNEGVNSPEGTRCNLESKSALKYSIESMRSSDSFSQTAEGSSTSTRAPAADYYYYGLLLSLIGYDNVSSDAPETQRTTLGWVALGSYYAASAVNILFEMTFDFLEATNPFMFFRDIATTSSAGSDELDKIYNDAETAAGGSGQYSSSINVLATFFGNIYNMFVNFAWAVSIPLSLLFIVVAFFLTRRGRYSAASKIKQLVIRVVFIAVGIPILGSAYTQVLDALKDATAMSDDFIAQAVSYTFLDFQAWVENNRLSPPSDESLAIITSQTKAFGTSTSTTPITPVVAPKTWRNIRQTCSALNVANGVFQFSDNYLIVTDNSGVLLKDFVYSTTSDAQLSTTGTAGNQKFDNKQSVSDIIKKYLNGDKYSASTFASGAVSWMKGQSGTGTTTFGDMLALSCDKYSFSPYAERDIRNVQGVVKHGGNVWFDPNDSSQTQTYAKVAQARFVGDSFTDVGYNIWNNGSITATESTAGTSGGGGSGAIGAPKVGRIFKSGSTSTASGAGYNCKEKTGFSTMAMYTYLTSRFTPSELITYGNAPSVYTQNTHYAVNIVGGNIIMQFAFFANTIAILLGYFVLAVFFVFRTAFDILFKGFQLMGHALFSALGFYKSIGTCICMTVNMIAQLFVSVIFFSFTVDLMFMITSIVDKLFFDIFDKLGGSVSTNMSITQAYSYEVLIICSTLLATFVIIFFVSFAIKWRAYLMSTLNGMVESIVGTLLGVSLSGTSDGVMGNMAKASLNEAANIMTGAAAAAGTVALAQGASDMANDYAKAFSGDDNSIDEDKSAVDASADPTIGSKFDGGSGAKEGDQQTKAEGMDALENGLPAGPYTKEQHDAMLANAKTQAEAQTNAEESKGEGKPAPADTTVTNPLDNSNVLPRNASTEQSGSEGTTTEAEKQEKLDSQRQSEEFYNGTGNENMDELSEAQLRYSSLGTNGLTDEEKEAWATGGFAALAAFGPSASKSKNKAAEDDESVEENASGEQGSSAQAGGNKSAGKQADDKRSAESQQQSEEFFNGTGNEPDSDLSDAQRRYRQNGVDGLTTEEKEAWSTGGFAALASYDTSDSSASGSTTAVKPDVTSGVSFDPARGIVMTSVDDNGNVSDFAIGMNGISMTSTDDQGNQTVTSFGSNGIQTTYTGVDGVTETTTTTFDGANSSVHVERSDGKGNTEEITSTLGGTVTKSTSVAADGSTRTVETQADGSQTITTTNAETGYESVENISANGASVKTESRNGVTTVTKSDADGDITSREITSKDENGAEIVTSFKYNDDGSQVSSITKGNSTSSVEIDAEGNKREVQTVMRSDGTSVETVTEYGNDDVADSVHTYLKGADGSSVRYESTQSAGVDETGTYTSTVAKTASGTVEIKDYGDGNVVTMETDASGDVTITKQKADGGYEISETNADTGDTRYTTIGSNGRGTTVVKNAAGETVETIDIKPDENGRMVYTNMSGGNVTFETVGSGADKQVITGQSYVTGGSIESKVQGNDKTVTITDGIGSESVETINVSSGESKTTFTLANGAKGETVVDANGKYSQTIEYTDGGSSSVTREVIGNDTVENVVKRDASGNVNVIESKNGELVYAETSSNGMVTFSQTADGNGGYTIRQTLDSGDVVTRNVEASGDYTQEIVHADGSYTSESSAGGKTTYKHTSITGIETSATKTGSAVEGTIEYEGVTFYEKRDASTGETLKTFTSVSGQSYSLTSDNEGTKTVFEMPNDTRGSVRVNNDGSQTKVIRLSDGSQRVENISTEGDSSVVYLDAKGGTVTDKTVITKLQDDYSAALSQFDTSFQGATQYINEMNAIPAFNSYTPPAFDVSSGSTVNVSPLGNAANATINFNPGIVETTETATPSLSSLNIPVGSSPVVMNIGTTKTQNLANDMMSFIMDSDAFSDVTPTDGSTESNPSGSRTPGSFGDYDTRTKGSTTTGEDK